VPEQTNYFLVIEGLDGSGKTELSRRLAATLQQRLGAQQVLLTHEPNEAACAGPFLREALGRRVRPVTNWTLALGFAANRADHTTRFIDPFLAAGGRRVVICDRYYLSSLVYQSDAQAAMDTVMEINQAARRPDLILFLNASNEVCYMRMDRREKNPEMFEDQIEQLRDRYFMAITYLRRRGENIVEINADPDISTVLDSMLACLKEVGPSWLR
jgi:dTMP kinase